MPPEDFDRPGTWDEEKRLVLSKVNSMAALMERMADRLEVMNTANRDRNDLMRKETGDNLNRVERQLLDQISKNSFDIAMMKANAKTFGAVAGFLAGAAITAVEFFVKLVK